MRTQSGFTLLEMIVVIGIASVMTGIAVLNVKRFDQAAVNAANDIASRVKGARSYAMSSTSTVRIVPISATSLRVTTARACSDTARVTVPELNLTLPAGAFMTNTSWSLCYTSRGISQESLNIAVNDRSRLRTVQVTLGGGVRIL